MVCVASFYFHQLTDISRILADNNINYEIRDIEQPEGYNLPPLGRNLFIDEENYDKVRNLLEENNIY